MIRIAIIGTGNIANAHMRAFLRQQGRCEVAALCDLVPGKAEQMKAQYGLKADCYEDYRQLLAREDIDLVMCAPRPSSMPRPASTPSGPGKMWSVRSPWPPLWRNVTPC